MGKNALSHFEIYADDPQALAKFYTSIFDWKIEAPPGMGGYLLVRTVETSPQGMATQPGGINGGIMKRPDADAPPVINYVNVESIEQTAERAKKLGAKVMKDKSPVPGMGWFAILTDPQNNPFALWQTDSAAK
jgi:predicted enzyme related to lactoylglutathione lyase